MTAVEDGDDWVLNGSKIWITNGDIADVIITFAANDRSLGTRGGITAFIIDTDQAGVRGRQTRGEDGAVRLDYGRVHPRPNYRCPKSERARRRSGRASRWR